MWYLFSLWFRAWAALYFTQHTIPTHDVYARRPMGNAATVTYTYSKTQHRGFCFFVIVLRLTLLILPYAHGWQTLSGVLHSTGGAEYILGSFLDQNPVRSKMLGRNNTYGLVFP